MSVRGQAVAYALVIETIMRLAWRRTLVALRDKIRDADDKQSEIVDCPEWDCKVEVRSMSAKARGKMLRESMTEEQTLDYEVLYPQVLIATCFDSEEGSQVFEPADAEWLADKSAGPVERLAQAGMRLSGLTQEAAEAGKETS